MDRAKYRCGATTLSGHKCNRVVKKYNTRCYAHHGIVIRYFYGWYPYPEVWVDQSGKTLINDIFSTDKEARKKASIAMRSEVKSYSDHRYELKICRDGLILIRVSKIKTKIHEFRKSVHKSMSGWVGLDETWQLTLTHLNLLSFLLISASFSNASNSTIKVFEVRELQKHDITRVTYQNNIPNRRTWYGTEPRPSIIRSTGMRIGSDSNSFHRPTVPLSVYDELNRLYVEFLNKPEAIKAISPIVKGKFEYLSKNFDSCLLLNWIFIEGVLVNKYKDYLVSINNTLPNTSSKRINSKRMKTLVSNKPVSAIIQQLELNNLISFSEFNSLEQLRKARNALIHNGKSCDKETALDVLNVAKSMFETKFGIQFSIINSDHSTSGL